MTAFDDRVDDHVEPGPWRGEPALALGQRRYDTRPSYPAAGDVAVGIAPLVDLVVTGRTLAIDGPPTVDWSRLIGALSSAVKATGVAVVTSDARSWMPAWQRLLECTSESVIPGDPHLSKLFTGSLADLLDHVVEPTVSSGHATIVFGPGAALVDADDIWYADYPKRLGLEHADRPGSVLGRVDDQEPSFKRMVFVDWPALDRHRGQLAHRFSRFIDATDPDRPTSLAGDDLRRSIEELASQPFRTVPHFMPGSWGGRWMQHTFDVKPEEENLAWSYELIAPEAGIAFGDRDTVEVPLDVLLAIAGEAIMGTEVTEEFGTSFPIRFDYLDTVDGGALSVHCHPETEYMAEVFGWPYTQEESYYLMVTSPDSVLYLGLLEEADLDEFERKARRAHDEGQGFDVTDFVATLPATQHQLYLIPPGTPHASGVGNVVLEVSATPYLYSLRFYDYLRTADDGSLRPIHVDHAFANVARERRGAEVAGLVPEPVTVRSGADWREELLGARPDLLFEVARLILRTSIEDDTAGRFHILNLVEGQHVTITTAGGAEHELVYGETILIPAAVGPYRIANQGAGEVMLVKSRVAP